MRLKELYIQEYKNLRDFRINFETNQGLTMLVGNNGSGKSNVLEAISAIFYDAYKSSGKKMIKDYCLNYEIDGEEISISKTNGRRNFKRNDRGLAQYVLIQQYLPHNVIGVYSGEENRLWLNYYEPFYVSYMRKVKGNYPQERMKLMYIDKYYWNIALLTFLLSENETIKPFIESELHIHSIDKVVIRFDINQYNGSENEPLKAFIDRINLEKKGICEFDVDTLKRALFYDRIVLGNTGIQIDDEGSVLVARNGISDAEVFNYLTQAAMPKTGKIITGIEIMVNNGVNTAQLSEGEKKLILVKAVLEFLADEKTLILFDEPDAHLHEGRKAKLYNMILEYQNPQILIATHSPTFIDIADQEQIYLIKNNDQGNAYIYTEDKIEVVRHLTGSRLNAFLEQPILFCEGTSTSVEASLYPILFPNYKIVPSGGHEEVIRNTKAYNCVFGGTTHRAIGIIDWDYRTDAQLSAYRAENIYSLKVVEIENVLLDLFLLEAARDQFCAAPDSVDKVQQKVFQDCSTYKEKQAKKYTANNMISKIKSELSPDGRSIEAFKSNVSRICSIEEIDRLYSERLQCLELYVHNALFEELVSIYDFSHNIDHLLNDVVNDYKNRILRLIGQRPDLQLAIKEKYYSDVPE